MKKYLSSIIKAILFISLFTIITHADDPMENLEKALTSNEGKTEFTHAIVVIDGKVFVAKTLHAFNVLKATADLCDDLQAKKLNDRIDTTTFKEKTAEAMKHTRRYKHN